MIWGTKSCRILCAEPELEYMSSVISSSWALICAPISAIPNSNSDLGLETVLGMRSLGAGYIGKIWDMRCRRAIPPGVRSVFGRILRSLEGYVGDYTLQAYGNIL
jgi:hypothetical protein